MKSFYLSIHLLLLVLTGCNTATTPEKEPGTIAALNIPNDTSGIDTAAKPAILSKEFTGRYVPNNDGNIFIGCDHNTYIIVDESNAIQSDYDKIQQNLSYKGESAAIKVLGYLKKHSKTGERDSLMVTKTLEVKPKSFQTECFNFEFIAIGNEPFWSVEIIPDENLISLKDVSTDKTYKFAYAKPISSGNTFIYDVNNGKNETLKVSIRKEACNDGMSDRNYQYSSSIVINGKPLSGCAIKKGDNL